jgi:hypothetical protein
MDTFSNLKKKIGSFLTSTRKVLLPTKQERLSNIQEERQQTLRPESAARMVSEDLIKSGTFDPVSASIMSGQRKVESAKDLNSYLSSPAIDPIGFVGGLRNVAKNTSSNLAKSISKNLESLANSVNLYLFAESISIKSPKDRFTYGFS